MARPNTGSRVTPTISSHTPLSMRWTKTPLTRASGAPAHVFQYLMAGMSHGLLIRQT